MDRVGVAMVFDNDDIGYQDWLKENQQGYVLNARRRQDPDYIVLHTSHCKHISKHSESIKSGGYTERFYIKVCSTNMSDLVEWTRQNGRPDGSFSKVCSKCI